MSKTLILAPVGARVATMSKTLILAPAERVLYKYVAQQLKYIVHNLPHLTIQVYIAHTYPLQTA